MIILLAIIAAAGVVAAFGFVRDVIEMGRPTAQPVFEPTPGDLDL
ncbi:hypothetical protein BH09PSE1_BH09PSE1_05240 [soil metagenome]